MLVMFFPFFMLMKIMPMMMIIMVKMRAVMWMVVFHVMLIVPRALDEIHRS